MSFIFCNPSDFYEGENILHLLRGFNYDGLLEMFPKEVMDKKLMCDFCKNGFSERFLFIKGGRVLCKSCAKEGDNN